MLFAPRPETAAAAEARLVASGVPAAEAARLTLDPTAGTAARGHGSGLPVPGPGGGAAGPEMVAALDACAAALDRLADAARGGAEGSSPPTPHARALRWLQEDLSGAARRAGATGGLAGTLALPPPPPPPPPPPSAPPGGDGDGGSSLLGGGSSAVAARWGAAAGAWLARVERGDATRAEARRGMGAAVAAALGGGAPANPGAGPIMSPSGSLDLVALVEATLAAPEMGRARERWARARARGATAGGAGRDPRAERERQAALRALVGGVMRRSGGRADAALASGMLEKGLMTGGL